MYMNETCVSLAKTQRLSHPLELLAPRTHLEFVFDNGDEPAAVMAYTICANTGNWRARTRPVTGPGRRLRRMKPMRLSLAA